MGPEGLMLFPCPLLDMSWVKRDTAQGSTGGGEDGQQGTVSSDTTEHSSSGPLQTTWGQPCAWHATPPASWICKVPPLSSEGTWAQKDSVSGPGHRALQSLALSLYPEKFRSSH